jgi:hypothetical protein
MGDIIDNLDLRIIVVRLKGLNGRWALKMKVEPIEVEATTQDVH